MSLPYEIKQDGKYKFIEEGQGEPLMLLHGLFGAMSNFSGIIDHFKHTHQVIVTLLPAAKVKVSSLPSAATVDCPATAKFLNIF